MTFSLWRREAKAAASFRWTKSLHLSSHARFNKKSFTDICFRMYSRHHVGGSRSSHQTVEAASSVRRGGPPVVQVDGLLLKGGAQLRRKSGDDKLCEAAHSWTRLQLQLARWNTHEGEFESFHNSRNKFFCGLLIWHFKQEFLEDKV